MKLPGILLLTLLAAAPRPAPADSKEGADRPLPYLFDSALQIRVTTNDDRRTVVHARDHSSIVTGVFDPLFDGDSGRQGKITSIRAATDTEIEHFPRLEGDHYAVLTYASGGLLMVTVKGAEAVKPLQCGERGVEIVRRNIACHLNLAKAKARFLDRLNKKFLSRGPSMASYKRGDFSVPGSGLMLHVGADGRTMWATDAAGRRLWKEDPFKVARMKPYRYFRPIIRFVEPFTDQRVEACSVKGEVFAGVGYNSTQFGCLNVRTGRFIFLGQD